MPPPFVYYLLISSFFATGFFFVLGVTLTALFRWNVSDAFSGSAVLFYSAFLFTGVFRVIKDAWSYWPYAFHSSKFLRAVPSGTNSSGAWLKNLSPFATSGAAALFVAGVFAFAWSSLGANGSAAATGTLRAELWFWSPAVLIVPPVLFAAMSIFGALFVRSYACYDHAPREISAQRLLYTGWILPETIAFLLINGTILAPILNAPRFDANAGVGALFAGAGVIAFSTAALYLSIVTPATPALTGAVFSRLWRVTGIAELPVSRPLPDAGALSFRFRDYFIPVFLLNVVLFAVWRAMLEWLPAAVTDGLSLASFVWFLIPAECVWIAAFVRFRSRVLSEDLVRVREFYRAHTYFYQPGAARVPGQLPAELVA